MAQKPSIPKGTRDFSPEEVVKRNYIMDTINSCFTTYGFQPIETPSFENSETLMGKYGEEGDRLIFKILNSGDYLSKFSQFFIDRTEKLFTSYFRNLASEKQMNPDIFIELENQKSDNILKVFTEGIDENFSFDGKNVFNTSFWLMFVEVLFAREETFLQIVNNLIKNDILTNKDHSAIKNESIILFQKWTNENNSFFSQFISEKALRYDLTVPFARYVVQHQNEITFPFKRYQMQPVWRADRPQKGRFREFYQCDADVVGSDSLWQEVELVQLYDAVFSKLKLKGTTIKMNNRKVLSGIAEVIGETDKLIDFTVALDKLDKIGEEGVKKEMREKGISDVAISKVQPLFTASGSASDKLDLLKDLLASSEVGMKGVEELSFIVNSVETLGLESASLEIDVTLARGLNYYTGAIFEVAAPEGVAMGSIGGGGRYDDLTGIFGLKNMSGVGISFGLDRIYLVLEELNLFPETASANTKVLFINFGEGEALYAMQAISKLRQQGISAELYPDAAKMGKQMGYADKRNIPFTVLAGASEMEASEFTLKNMKSGEQVSLDFEALVAKF